MNTTVKNTETPTNKLMKVVINPDFNQMSEQDRNRTISIDKKFL